MADYSDKAKFGNYAPWTFGWNKRDPLNNSSLLVPFGHSGAYFGLMHKDVVGLFNALLDELVPLIPGGIAQNVDDGCYNPNSVTESGTRSFHTYAIAIDINWQDNPMYQNIKTGDGVVPDKAAAIARKYGCEWGGSWITPKDRMHIECHLPPAVARTVQPEAKVTEEQANEILERLTRLENMFLGSDGKRHRVETIAAKVVYNQPYVLGAGNGREYPGVAREE